MNDDDHHVPSPFSSSSEDEDEDDDDAAILAVFLAHMSLEFEENRKVRMFKMYRKYVDWDTEVEYLRHSKTFAQTYKIEYDPFMELVDLLRPNITLDAVKAKNQGSQTAIYPEMVVAIGMRWAAGGRWADIKDWAKISKASFYRIQDMFIDAVIACEDHSMAIEWPTTEMKLRSLAREFAEKSDGDCIRMCVGAIDGMLVKIFQPRYVENPRSYYSGHYECFGLNLQAVCDIKLRFIFVGIGGPGATPDVSAYNYLSIRQLVEQLPGTYHLVGDAAYVLTNKMLTPFTGASRSEHVNDVFNFHLSQLRIRIEMAFGRLTSKFRILRQPMEYDLPKVCKIVKALSKLHNFIINKQTSEDHTEMEVDAHPKQRRNLGYFETSDISPQEDEDRVSDYVNNYADGEEHMVTDEFDQITPEYDLRQSIVDYITESGLERSTRNIIRNS